MTIGIGKPIGGLTGAHPEFFEKLLCSRLRVGLAQTQAVTAAFIAPPLVPLSATISTRSLRSLSKNCRAPQVKALCAPPPASASAIFRRPDALLVRSTFTSLLEGYSVTFATRVYRSSANIRALQAQRCAGTGARRVESAQSIAPSVVQSASCLDSRHVPAGALAWDAP